MQASDLGFCAHKIPISGVWHQPPRGPPVGQSVDTAECTSQVLLAVMASMPLVGQSVDAAEWAL